MTVEVRTFIIELIEEIDHLQQCVDGEFSTDFELSEADRAASKQNYLATLEELSK